MADNTTPEGLKPITEVQPQIAQFEVLFPGPLVKDSAVAEFEDLVKLNPKFNYKHKQVWVREYKSNYYLDNGDGTEPQNWKRAVARVVLERYDPMETYQKGDSIYLSGKIYSALQFVPEGISPLDNEDYWLTVAGETETYRFLFQNTAKVLIYTEIRNPKFEIILGDLMYDENGEIIICKETGLAVLSNQEIVEAHTYQREDLSHDNGVAYQIEFYEDSVLTPQKSGCINVK